MKKLIVLIFLNAVLSQSASSVEETGYWCKFDYKNFMAGLPNCKKGDVLEIGRAMYKEALRDACTVGSLQWIKSDGQYDKHMICFYSGSLREKRPE